MSKEETMVDRCASVPKCTSWRGHKFEARFSYSTPTDAAAVIGAIRDGASDVKFKLHQDRTYQHDICVRCGHVVPRQPHNGDHE